MLFLPLFFLFLSFFPFFFFVFKSSINIYNVAGTVLGIENRHVRGTILKEDNILLRVKEKISTQIRVFHLGANYSIISCLGTWVRHRENLGRTSYRG